MGGGSASLNGTPAQSTLHIAGTACNRASLNIENHEEACLVWRESHEDYCAFHIFKLSFVLMLKPPVAVGRYGHLLPVGIKANSSLRDIPQNLY